MNLYPLPGPCCFKIKYFHSMSNKSYKMIKLTQNKLVKAILMVRVII